MRPILTLLIAIGLLSLPLSNTIASGDEHWFQGGSLHNATVTEWKQAAYSNRLATAADWLAATTWKGHLSSHDSFDRLKDKARKLVQAVDEATMDISPDDLGGVITAKEVAALIISMSNDLGPY
jgi:hypothetical protein